MRGLSQNDISIPLDLSSRSDNKLMLDVVKRLMNDPLAYNDFVDSVSTWDNLPIDSLYFNLYSLLDFNSSELIFRSTLMPQLHFDQFKSVYNDYKNLYNSLNKNDRDFLSRNLLSIISEAQDIESNVDDIFKYNEAREMSIEITKKTLQTLEKIDREKLFDINLRAILLFSKLYEELKQNPNYITRFIPDSERRSLFREPLKINLFDDKHVLIGSRENDVHVINDNTIFVFDIAGNDKYIYNTSKSYFDSPPFLQVVIDLDGDDIYISESDKFGVAGGFFGAFMIFDSKGTDRYEGGNVSVSAAICGTALIFDEQGNDFYSGNSFSIGAASFGSGLIIDARGNDIYNANSYSQAFGMTMGIGAIIDKSGNDSYIISAGNVDLGRYEDHYISMCQGYGLGVRPYYAGGIGLLIESGGNDIYNTDIFGQGGSYWFALGVLIDKHGHDKYNSYQYAQGAGIHLSVGILKDYNGWDFYSSNGVSQGCGHDYGVGILHDVSGNDNYSAYSLSQGAGSANGIGILIDEEGRDGYLNKESVNTRGYGNPRREFGSLGIFADFEGVDFYSVSEKDSTFNIGSYWGVMVDFPFMKESVVAGSESYKIPVDSSKQYSTEEFFTMAKTIEPRFSLWQQYGERNLIKDSLGTARYILSKLVSEDHRDAFLIRNLIFKINQSVSSIFLNELKKFEVDRNVLRPEEVIFIAYLFGETKDATGAEAMYKLLFDPDERIRSSALASIGKINFSDEFTGLKSDIISRIHELYLVNQGSKIYRKNIAFALSNLHDSRNVRLLIDMLGDEFYGTRFIAAGNLCEFTDDSLLEITASIFNRYGNEIISQVSFMNSFYKLKNEDIINLYNNFSSVIMGNEFLRYSFLSSLINRDTEEINTIRKNISNGLNMKMFYE